jgi:hypothetical protein
MLDRSIPTRKALVHSIPISEVKDMKSDVLRATKKNFIDFEFLDATFPPLGSKKIRNSLAIPFFLSSHTHSYLLILLKYKNQVFFQFFIF